MEKPKLSAFSVSHSNAGVSSNSSVSGREPGVAMSTARPVWCSLWPGAALTVRMSSICCPALIFLRIRRAW